MIGFRPLRDLRDPVDLLAWLDFCFAHQPEKLPLLLRGHALFCGSAIIPDVFLLHNRSILAATKNELIKTEIEGFLRSPFACISVPDRLDMQGFGSHRRAAMASDNPMVITDEEGGAGYADFLDQTTSDTSAWVFSYRQRIDNFQDNFRVAAARARIPQIADELIALRTLTAGRIGQENREEIDGIRTLTRSDILLLLGEGRSADPSIPSCRDKVPRHILINKNRILESASAAYCRGIVAGLPLPTQQSVAAGNWWHPTDGIVHLATSDEVLESLSRSQLFGHDEPVCIDWARIAGTSWNDLAKFLAKDEATLYFRRRLQFGDRPDPSTLIDLLDAMASYLQLLGNTYGTRSTKNFIFIHTSLRPQVITVGLALCGLAIAPMPFATSLLFGLASWGLTEYIGGKLEDWVANRTSSGLKEHLRSAARHQLLRTRYDT